MRNFDPIIVRVFHKGDVGHIAEAHGLGALFPTPIEDRAMFGNDDVDLNRNITKPLTSKRRGRGKGTGNDFDLRVASTNH